MFPGPRGSAAVFAVVLSAVVLSAALWLVLGTRKRDVENRIATLGRQKNGATGDAEALSRKAEGLTARLRALESGVSAPSGLSFVRRKPEAPPRISGLKGTLRGDSIHLTWRCTGHVRQFRVERVEPSGRLLLLRTLPAGARSYTDGPLRSLAGTMTYRISAVADDQTVAGAAEKVAVPFHVPFDLRYLGPNAAGNGRFEVLWRREGAVVREVFAAAPGTEIGGSVAAAAGRPALDFHTGYRFLRLAAVRRLVSRNVETPEFTPEGTVVKDPKTGAAVTETRDLPAPLVVEGALVEPPPFAAAGGEKWLPKAKE